MPDGAEGLLGGVPVRWGTFLDTPPEQADLSAARVVVVPVPYDGTTSYRGGARDGPTAILDASRHLEDYDLELDRDISLVGIHTAPEISPDASGPEALIDQVRRAVLSVAERGKLAALLGGEHTIAIGAVKALAQVHSDLSVLCLDAHADLRDTYLGTAWGHASVNRRLHDICPIALAGVRSLSASERGFAKDVGLPLFYWGGPTTDLEDLLEEVLEALSSQVYVSIDLDVFDPSVMAAVGTPEPGGLGWREVTWLLKAVADRRQVVGFDVAELSPNEGPEACAYTAAKLAYKLMGYATSR
jgi:agmatinase